MPARAASAGYLDEFFGLMTYLAHAYGQGASRYSRHDSAEVQRNDVSALNSARPGYAVHHLVVDGHAQAGRVAVVALEGRPGAPGRKLALGDVVKFPGLHARLDTCLQHLKYVRHYPSGASHGRNLGLVLDGYDHLVL
jgi:hypothetical protein